MSAKYLQYVNSIACFKICITVTNTFKCVWSDKFELEQKFKYMYMYV